MLADHRRPTAETPPGTYVLTDIHSAGIKPPTIFSVANIWPAKPVVRMDAVMRSLAR